MSKKEEAVSYLRGAIAPLVGGDEIAESVVSYLSGFPTTMVQGRPAGEDIFTYLVELSGSSNGTVLRDIVQKYCQICNGKANPPPSVLPQPPRQLPPPPPPQATREAPKSTPAQAPTAPHESKLAGNKLQPQQQKQTHQQKQKQEEQQNRNVVKGKGEEGSKDKASSSPARVDVKSSKPSPAPPSSYPTSPPAAVTIRCGCFASHHPYAGSCLSCGRVMCAKEGEPPRLCPVCGDVMLGPLNSTQVLEGGRREGGKDDVSEGLIRAYELKDKLLVFDRENAKRTHVHDAQGDYYESTTWLTEEEKQAIDAREEERRSKLKPSNRKMNFTIDVQGRRFVESKKNDEGEYEEEEQGHDDDDEGGGGVIRHDGGPHSGKKGNTLCHPRQNELDDMYSDSRCDRTGGGSESEDFVDTLDDMGIEVNIDNVQLRNRHSKAGDMYRMMKQLQVDRQKKAKKASSMRGVGKAINKGKIEEADNSKSTSIDKERTRRRVQDSIQDLDRVFGSSN